MHKYIEKYKLLFLDSNRFFKSVQKEIDYFEILKFYVVLMVVSEIISIIFSIPLFFKSSLFLYASFVGLISTAVLAFVFPFIGAGIIHLGVLIFKGKEGYFNTFKSTTYAVAIGAFYNVISSAITGIYSWFFPIDLTNITASLDQLSSSMFVIVVTTIIGLISLAHILYTQITGLTIYQKMDRTKALLAVITIPLILLIIGVVLLALGLTITSRLYNF